MNHTDETLAPDAETVGAAVWTEFTLWEPPAEQADTHPEPGEPGGLPDGWLIEDQLPHPTFPNSNLLLIRRTDGGWLIVRHDMGRVRPFWIDVNLGALHTHVAQVMVDPESLRDPLLPALEAWLRRVLMDRFNLSDPVERAEHVLFALGGPVGYIPRAAR